MKSKLIILGLAGLLAGSTVGWSQDKPAADKSVAHDPNEVIPLIVMDDVGLVDAIKNLARQANLNYILDPKVTFGAPGPDGKPAPQPTISIRWEKLTAQQALVAVLNNYNLQIVDDPKTQIARITTKDPAAPDPLVTKIIQLKFASPTNIQNVVQSNLTDKRSKVIGDIRTSQLVVLATEKELLVVDDLVVRLDTPTKQVLIEAKLVETSSNPKTKKGIDWTSTLQAQNLTFGNNAQRSLAPNLPSSPGPAGPSTILPAPLGGVLNDPKFIVGTSGGLVPYTAFLNADGVKTVLSFLNSDADSQVLSTPRAVTLDNQEATLSVTRAEPIFATTAGTQGSPGGSQVTYTNLGTILKVTPRISANDFVNLKVIPEVSSVFNTITKTVAGSVNQADEYDVRRIETQVLIPSGNTLVMGGLVKNNSSKSWTKVPFFGDIPLLGAAFRSESKTREKNNLMIFITPTIVTDEDYQIGPKTDFLKSKFVEEPEMKATAWDSARHLDWSKPILKNTAHEQNLKE